MKSMETPKPAPSLPSLINAQEAAQLLGVKPSTVHEWQRFGYLPCVRYGRGKRQLVRFDIAELSRWIQEKAEAGRTSRIPAL